MVIYACPQCGSRRIRQGALHVGALTGTKDVCRDCNYQGIPLIFDTTKDYHQFLKELHKNSTSKAPTKSLTKQEKEIIDFGVSHNPISEKILEEKKPYGLLIIIVVTFLYSVVLLPSLILPFLTILTSSIQILFEWYIVLLYIFSGICLVLIPYGFLKRKKWAYTFSGIFFILAFPTGLIFLYYLTRPHVKAYFNVA